MKQGVKYFLIEVTLGKNKMWKGRGRGRQDVNNQQCSFFLSLIDDWFLWMSLQMVLLILHLANTMVSILSMPSRSTLGPANCEQTCLHYAASSDKP